MRRTDGRRSLVTGGAGFIGSNLVDALVARGDEVTILDDLSTGRLANLDGARAAGAVLVEADVRNPSEVDDAVARAAPDRIFHLAAQIDVRRSLHDPQCDARVNVIGTINVLEAARRHGVSRVVNTSTGGAIYGEAAEVPTPEGAEERPLAAYGTSKLCAEHYCAWAGRLHGLSVGTVRLANVYGPRQDPLGEAGVVAIFCDRLLAGTRPTIHGTGQQTRDFVFVDDVVAAQLRMADAGIAGPVNVGTGRETSVLELAAAVAEAGHAEGWFAPHLAPARAGEVVRSCLDGGRARRELGFVPRVPLIDGLRTTIAWVARARARRAALPTMPATGAPVRRAGARVRRRAPVRPARAGARPGGSGRRA
jgi:UDP-glucose 4-epimerase